MKSALYTIIGALIFVGVSSLAQDSLGDFARQQRWAKPATPALHEITNDDLATTASTATSTSPDARNPSSEIGKDSAKDGASKAAEVQAKISAQKEQVKALEDKIAADQKKLDEMTCPKGVTCGQRVLLTGTGMGAPGPTPCQISDALSWHPYQDWCDEPDKLQDEIDATQKQLDSERAVLDSLQEEARRQGFGNSIYDPD